MTLKGHVINQGFTHCDTEGLAWLRDHHVLVGPSGRWDGCGGGRERAVQAEGRVAEVGPSCTVHSRPSFKGHERW